MKIFKELSKKNFFWWVQVLFTSAITYYLTYIVLFKDFSKFHENIIEPFLIFDFPSILKILFFIILFFIANVLMKSFLDDLLN
ncbi:MAG: hypothetical protein ACRDD2_01500 [Sarcina sp.]